MTKELLNNYRYLDEIIRKDEEKLQYYKDNPPSAYVGKVQSSNKEFPYQKDFDRGIRLRGQRQKIMERKTV